MELEYLKESIKNYTEIRRTLWTALFGLIGAASALFITLDSLAKGFLLTIAIIAVIVDIIVIQEANQKINAMLKKIKELKNEL